MTDLTILLVEDDEIDARAVRRAFRKSRIANDLVVAKDGREALDVLRGDETQEPLQRPYVVLLDLNMPGMNGFEFLEELRSDEALRRSIVFVLTTSDDERDLTRAYDSLVAGYVLKSRAGKDFIHLVEMLDGFEITVSFPSA